MSQTDPKTQPGPSNPPKSAVPKPNPQGGVKKPQAKGGSQAMLYVVAAVLIVGAIAVASWLRHPSEQRRPVVSAAEEEGYVVAPETEEEAEEAAAPPALVINSDVRGADVFLNGNRVGKTPHKATPLEAGTYDVKVVHEGYEPFEQQVRVEGPDESIQADLKPIQGAQAMKAADAGEPAESAETTATTEAMEPAAASADIRGLGDSVAVKHKHRFGSCAGVLRTSTDGVHYDSDHKDAFSAAYADIEELSVDGDELTLKVRDGRKYDFGAEGEEQALAAFHARVEAKLH